MFVIKQKQHPSPNEGICFFCHDVLVLVSPSEWQEYYYSSHCRMQPRGGRHEGHTQLCLQLPFLGFVWSQTQKGPDRGESPIIFRTEEWQISLVLSLFHIKMSGEPEGKQENFRRESKTRSTVFHCLFSSSEMFTIPYLSVVSRSLQFILSSIRPVAVVVI